MTPFAPQLLLENDESLDLKLILAGPGARAYAFLIDWHFRFIAATLWMVVMSYLGKWLYGFELSTVFDEPDSYEALVVWLPAVLMYLLYHPVFEIAWRGRTPGKRLAGLRVIDSSGRPATATQILIRNVFRLVDSVPVLYALGIVVSALQSRHQRIGDIAAATVVAHDPTALLKRASQLWVPPKENLSVAEMAFVRDLLERWDSLDMGARDSLVALIAERVGSAKLRSGNRDDQRKLMQAWMQPV